MRLKYILPVVVLVLLFSCKKDTVTSPPVVTPPPVTPPPAPAVVFLKDITIPNLPSPYYHFEYNANGSVNKTSFASGFTQYDVSYNANALSEMKNNTLGNQDRLEYVLDNLGRATSIKYINAAGENYRIISLAYDGDKLEEIAWQLKVAAGFVFDRTVSFTYQADGNLLEMIDHRIAVQGGPQEAFYISHFEQYDNKVNADGFSLIHDNFHDHLFLLPGVQLQKNNPRKVIFTGTGVHYTVNYNYTYNGNNAPLTKTGDLLFSKGPDAGHHFQVSTAYSYY